MQTEEGIKETRENHPARGLEEHVGSGGRGHQREEEKLTFIDVRPLERCCGWVVKSVGVGLHLASPRTR